MVMRLFLLYVVVEMAVIVALTATIGFGWTVLALAGAFALGLVLAGSQLRRQLTRLRAGITDPGAQVTDSALIALGTLLVFIPGLVTTALGLLMLAPPTRSAMRPLAAGLASRGLSRHVTFVGGRREYIDGEVIEVHDHGPAAAPTRPAIRPEPE
ncbi:FxsA family protein [[Mycobacterium] wendilense]|uniref:FxsA family protein n=1 Tax=[Mycobacterium] wendilense TaxID=3064284 RepID=A0ABM9ME53_9MYCO|nr:FxsA family protein [Mycolicibacterium sp. MU0050]CAJ1583023.1 FxsA family protein [Mycolicibacterium sp. MU0050]